MVFTGWKIRGNLQQWEAVNLIRAQKFAGQLVRANERLPRKISLLNLYDAAQGEFTASVEQFAQRGDSVAREVLGILKPSPEIELVAHHEPISQPLNLKAILITDRKDIEINITGISFFVDEHLEDEPSTKYTLGTVFYLAKTHEIMRITKKSILVGKRIKDPLQKDEQEKRMAKLRRRIAGPHFIEDLKKDSKIAIVDIREYPVETGELEKIFSSIIYHTSEIISEILSAASKGPTESDGHILMVDL